AQRDVDRHSRLMRGATTVRHRPAARTRRATGTATAAAPGAEHEDALRGVRHLELGIDYTKLALMSSSCLSNDRKAATGCPLSAGGRTDVSRHPGHRFSVRFGPYWARRILASLRGSPGPALSSNFLQHLDSRGTNSKYDTARPSGIRYYWCLPTDMGRRANPH